MVCFFSAEEISKNFPIWAGDDSMIGFVDSIELNGDQISVTGWANADEVGLQDGGTRISKVPNLPRPDVIETFPELDRASSSKQFGFSVAANLLSENVFFFVRQGTNTYYFHL
ncbi:hypothetical protein [Paracoccus sp. IB05]|uniref:hypothetical protein n=1 Tax=Paracoccus sp. IB05 TaxID=2779367 RepID=UPI0018E77EF4|nr:hypothetical protein [Paracoccus sp. IB05]MBJ2153574.1 hypothetical protein [Paracoccus sp. IB05]